MAQRPTTLTVIGVVAVLTGLLQGAYSVVPLGYRVLGTAPETQVSGGLAWALAAALFVTAFAEVVFGVATVARTRWAWALGVWALVLSAVLDLAATFASTNLLFYGGLVLSAALLVKITQPATRSLFRF